MLEFARRPPILPPWLDAPILPDPVQSDACAKGSGFWVRQTHVLGTRYTQKEQLASLRSRT